MTSRVTRAIARRVARELFTDKDGKRIQRLVVDFEYWRKPGTYITEADVVAMLSKSINKKNGGDCETGV